MNNAYCNMSVPPRTTMMKDVRLIVGQIVMYALSALWKLLPM